MELAHHRAGTGDPLLLIHGTGSQWQAFGPVLEALGARRDVITRVEFAVQQAVEVCTRRDELHAERVGVEVRRLAGAAAPRPLMTPLCQYQVPRPDLGRFNQLLSQGESQDG